jgi:hypothetical protein
MRIIINAKVIPEVTPPNTVYVRLGDGNIPYEEKPMKEPMTICTKCQHVKITGRSSVWTRFECYASIIIDGVNPVTGEPQDTVLAKCHNRNTGDCKLYEEAR